MIAKELLEILVNEGLSTYQIAKRLQSSQTNVRHYLNKFKLITIRARKPEKYICKHCGESDQEKFYKRKRRSISRYVCIDCSNRQQAEKNRKIKLLAIAYKGGKCQKCSYNRCPGALSFHHRNPEEKDTAWKSLKNHSFEKIKFELDKCDLLCNNCHAETHWVLDGNKL